MPRASFGRKITDFTRKGLEDEINRYKDDDFLWHKHITGVTLYPHQQVITKNYDQNHTCLHVSSRRIGKSFTASSFFLKESVTKPRSEINIHAPALEQSKRNLRYIIDMVLNSSVLTAYIEKKLGEGIGKESIEFINGSSICAKGQASSVDGLGATHQWWEEVDDMDIDVLYERIYPTGSMLKPGYDYGKWGQCFRLATGTIKGMGNIYNFENPRSKSEVAFHVLPKYTGWHGVHWGIIPRNDLLLARNVLMTPEQFARAYLCLYTESANFFPTRIIDSCQDPLHEIINIVEYKRKNKTNVYQAVGGVTFGIDCGGQGVGEHPSEWAISFVEDLGYNRMRWLYGERFGATENPDTVKHRIAKLLEFFRPVRGLGDAFDTTFHYALNKICYELKLTPTNVEHLENRQGEGGWADWFLSPVRFLGPNKHQFYKNLRLRFFQKSISIPYLVTDHEDYKELQKLRDQLENIKVDDKSMATGYSSYAMIRNAIGDDYVDSLALAVYAQGEMTKTVRPIGLGVENKGFKGFNEANVNEGQQFTNLGKDMFDNIGNKRPLTMNEFLKD